jgi:hypothetical protein
MEDLKIKISNFKLNIFAKLLEQSLIVDDQIMLEFSPEMIKSCSFSSTKSFMKLWSIPLNDLIQFPDGDDIENLDKEQEISDFPVFNFYILKGNLFKNYISVHTTDTVDLEFIIQKKQAKYYAANMIISGNSETKSPLITTFILTTEEMISNSINDYSEILAECTPSNDMIEFIITDIQIQEIKQLIKKLHKSSANNTPFLTFTVDPQLKKVNVNDKVFNISFDLINTNPDKLPDSKIIFNILKTDFVMTGNHTFSIFINNNEQKIILGSNYRKAIIWCLSSKTDENALSVIDESNLNASIDSLNVSEYFDKEDGLPF